VSLVFGFYASVVGVAIVFITLLAVAAASEVLRKLLCGRAETIAAEDRKHATVAAMAAVHYYISLEGGRPPRVRAAAGPSRWSTVARIEALGIKGERFR